jgi:hypothetical protein
MSIVLMATGACGVDAGCNCGAAVVSKSQRIAAYDAANPGKSTRQVAEALGVGNKTVHRARQNSGVSGDTPDRVRTSVSSSAVPSSMSLPCEPRSCRPELAIIG